MVLDRIKKFFQLEPFEFTQRRIVQIGKGISGDKLEEILIKAAHDINLNTESSDKFITHYVLGSVREEKRYLETYIKLESNNFSATCSVDKQRSNYNFSIHFKPSQKQKVEEYLNVVSKYI